MQTDPRHPLTDVGSAPRPSLSLAPPPTHAAHSDPEELKLAAAEARAAADAGSPAFLERQARVQALVEALRVEPSEADLMRVSNGSSSGSLYLPLA